jgi:hypothetical protein
MAVHAVAGGKEDPTIEQRPSPLAGGAQRLELAAGQQAERHPGPLGNGPVDRAGHGAAT